MDKVRIIFYENYGSNAVKEVHNVIPTSIRMYARNDLYGRKQLYLSYKISDVIEHDGSYALKEGISFSIFSNVNQ